MAKKSKLLKGLFGIVAIATIPLATTSCADMPLPTILENGLSVKQNMVVSLSTYLGFSSYYALHPIANANYTPLELFNKLFPTIDGIFVESSHTENNDIEIVGNLSSTYSLEKTSSNKIEELVIFRNYVDEVKDENTTLYDLEYDISTKTSTTSDLKTYESTGSGVARKQKILDGDFNVSFELTRNENSSTIDFNDTATFTFVKDGTTDTGFMVKQENVTEEGALFGQQVFSYYDLKDQTKPVYSITLDYYHFIPSSTKLLFEADGTKYWIYCKGTPRTIVEATEFDDITKTVVRWEYNVSTSTWVQTYPEE